jgi:hypothetical protein
LQPSSQIPAAPGVDLAAEHVLKEIRITGFRFSRLFEKVLQASFDSF